MDGSLGHGKAIYKSSSGSLEETIKIDKYKDLKAMEHGLNIIRIDASQSNQEFISQKIIESNIFSEEEIKKVDFNECDKFTCKNLVKYVCSEYERLKPITYHDLSKKLKIPLSTTHNYLIKGKKLQMCSYEGSEYSNIKYTVKVACFDQNMNFIKTYNSIKDAEEEIGVHGISACCRGKQKTAGGYIWKYNDCMCNIEEGE